jgi:hypothetical protein
VKTSPRRSTRSSGTKAPAAAKPAATRKSAAERKPAAARKSPATSTPPATAKLPAAADPTVTSTPPASTLRPAAEPSVPAAAPSPAAGSATTELPLPNYQELTFASIRARMRSLDPDQIRGLLDYERTHADRANVITMFERRIVKLEEAGDADTATP